MANFRREPTSYRPFRTEPLLAEGLLAVARPGGELEERIAAGMFRLAAEAGAVADRKAEREGRIAGGNAGLAGAPDATVNGVTAAGRPAGAPLTGDKAARAARAKQYLIERHGLSSVAAAGVVGNLAAESAFNPDARNPGDGRDGSDSIGIAQWNAGRARALRSFASSRGRAVNDFETQLDFLVHELSTSESTAGRKLRAATTVEDATAAFIGFERPQGWTPENPRGGHNWSGRLAAARAAAGDDRAPTTQPDAAAPPGVTVSGGGFRPTGRDTVYGRAFDEAGVKSYSQMLETEMRSTSAQVFDLYKDDPAALDRALGALTTELERDHVFDEIRPDFRAGMASIAETYLAQARDRLARKAEAQDRADFYERTQTLATERAQRIAAFDPASPDAADAIASSQAAIDSHYDSAVRRGILDPDDAVKLKAADRREAALGYYTRQAEGQSADGIKAMRAEMRADFGAGELEGLDGDGWTALDGKLAALEARKRSEGEQAVADLRRRGDAQAARLAAGFEVDPAAMTKLMLDAGATAEGKAALAETFAKISASRAIRDFSVSEGEKHVAGLRKQFGATPTDGELRTLAHAEATLAAKRKAISTDPVSYAEAQGIVPGTPMLTEAGTPDALAATMAARADAALQASRALGAPVRYLKAGEAKALGQAVRADPASGAMTAGAIVAGAGASAPAVLAEFGSDAPMIAEAGAIIAFGGSARAAEDVILGYGKGVDGKQLKGLKPETARESFRGTIGGALGLAVKDAGRVERAAASIARKRISEEGLDPESEEAIAIHTQAVHEAAGAVFDRGAQFGGFAEVGGGWFSTGARVLVPPEIRADDFGDVLASLTDADFDGLRQKPKAGFRAQTFLFDPGGGERVPLGLAATLRGATPVYVGTGYAFAFGDPSGDDPQFVQGDDGMPFVLDVTALRSRLETRTPGAWR